MLFGTVGTALAGTIYVDANAAPGGDGTTWGTAYKYLQDAFYKPPTNGDEIWVAAGIYKPDQDEGSNVTPGDRMATFELKDGVSIYGGFPIGGGAWEERDPNLHETILSGDLNGDDEPNFVNNGENSYNVCHISWASGITTLDGFTLTGGYADDSGSWRTSSGGGLYGEGGGDAIVANCIFSRNWAWWGGGIAIDYPSGSTSITNCNFEKNYAYEWGGGGIAFMGQEGSPVIKECIFTQNSTTEEGGGIWCNECTLIQCTFIDNNADVQGGGVRFTGYTGDPFNVPEAYPTVISSTFVGNTAGSGGGGAIYNYVATRPTFINCEFAGNYTEGDGGAIIIDAFNPYPANIYLSITNCSFAGNKAAGSGGACYIYTDDIAETTIKNTILWANVDSTGSGESSQVTGGTLFVSSSCIQDDDPNDGYIPFGGAANNNIDDNPRFARDPNDGGDGWGVGDNDDFGDLHLRYTSPCIDTGDNAAVPSDSNDIDNDGNTTEPIPWDLDSHPRITDGDCNDTDIVDMGAYEFAYLYLGDFAGGCDVDFADFAVLALAWLTEEGQAGYDSNCDIALPYDKAINEKDLRVFTNNWLLGR